ncbi:hypothetical protein ETU10_08660 [Apibacter muscae]|uniref:hypothetical protein n=1 Tax=Apibacter muscae TaxID=2509004 RepID=UPI0011AD5D38|nr:hypothetical protein [Apibacter muscae]TWP23157.1 hypothetical protein ETU10_08660 [Apibacter muscae]
MESRKILDIITRVTTNNINNILNWGDRVSINNIEGEVVYIGSEEIILSNKNENIVFKIEDISSIFFFR